MEELFSGGGMGGGGGGAGKIATSKAESDSANNFGDVIDGGGKWNPLAIVIAGIVGGIGFLTLIYLVKTK